jgi:hypothetical protein
MTVVMTRLLCMQQGYGNSVGVREQSYRRDSRAIETEYFWLRGKCFKDQRSS